MVTSNQEKSYRNQQDPNKQEKFLRDGRSKTRLFHSFADKLCKTRMMSTVTVTKEDAISNTENSVAAASSCSQEETDT